MFKKRNTIAGLLALSLLTPSVSASAASTTISDYTTPASVEIIPGDFTMTSPVDPATTFLNFGQILIDGSIKTVVLDNPANTPHTPLVPITVEDWSGTGTGWKVTVQATDFTAAENNTFKLPNKVGPTNDDALILAPITLEKVAPSTTYDSTAVYRGSTGTFAILSATPVTLVTADAAVDSASTIGEFKISFGIPHLVLKVDTAKKLVDPTVLANATPKMTYKSDIVWSLVTGP